MFLRNKKLMICLDLFSKHILDMLTTFESIALIKFTKL